MRYPQPRDEAKLDRLLGYRERSRNDCLAGDDSRRCGEQNERETHHVGGEIEEWFLRLAERLMRRGRKDHCALSHVVQEKRRQDEVEPRGPDGLTTEVSHVGVKRLSSRDGQNH